MKNNGYKYTYASGFFLLLIVLPLIFNDIYCVKSFYFFPNLVLAGIVYVSAYMEIYAGILTAYAVFYIFGSLTSFNPSLFSLAGTVAFSAAYLLWRRIQSENIFTEFAVTFISSATYYLVLSGAVFYGLNIEFSSWNFFFSYAIPVSVATSIFSPLVFMAFKKIKLGSFLRKSGHQVYIGS